MANPVTVDFSATKTLVAFGERFQKHSPIATLQQFIDYPEKLGRLVDFANAGAPEWQVKVLPDIDWRFVYRKFGMEAEYADFARTIRWADPKLWIVPMVTGITCNKVISVMKAEGVKFWQWTNDIDAELASNERDPKDGSYVIGFRRNVEADEENKNLSAKMLADQSHKGITLPERLVLGAGYFWTTGQHLDVLNITLCPGSRGRVGGVPGVDFFPGGGGVAVGGYGPGDRSSSLRSRTAVPPPVA